MKIYMSCELIKSFSGFDGHEVMSTAEMYDTNTKQWSYIPSMTSPRSGVSLITFRNILYAIGGFNGNTRLASGEKFCPNGAAWTDINDMLTPRSNFATVVLDDYIYVIGGFNDRCVSGKEHILLQLIKGSLYSKYSYFNVRCDRRFNDYQFCGVL